MPALLFELCMTEQVTIEHSRNPEGLPIWYAAYRHARIIIAFLAFPQIDSFYTITTPVRK